MEAPHRQDSPGRKNLSRLSILSPPVTPTQKNKHLRTVVNKLDNIDTEFRFFKMEVLAGDPDFIVDVSESNCRFKFDFSQVYWNSRLHSEHERPVKRFEEADVVADVFAGVGPFAVPAAKKGCAVFGNDLNPNSAKYMLANSLENKVRLLDFLIGSMWKR